MRPDTGPFLALASFRTPVPLPPSAPLDGPQTTVSFGCAWLPYVRGALLQLVQQYTWPQDNPAAVTTAQMQAMDLISLFAECGGVLPPIACGYDFEESDAGWYQGGFCGQWVDRAGWESTEASFGDNCIDIIHDLVPPNVVTHIQFNYSAETVGAGPDSNENVQVLQDGVWTVVHIIPLQQGVHVVDVFGSWADVSGIRVGTNAGTNTGLQRIFSARYDGFGDNGCG